MWIEVFTILDKKLGDIVTTDTLYSMAESQLYLFSSELTVPEYDAYCDDCVTPNQAHHDPDCELCKGTGTYKTKSNPQRKFEFWDFRETSLDYSIENAQWNEKQPKIKNEICGLTTAIVTTNQLLMLKYIPLNLITPDIRYYEEYNNVNWNQEAKNILQKYPNHYVVPASCHI